MSYPEKLACTKANKITLECIAATGVKNVAEIGVYQGHTSVEIAKLLPEDGALHLFDYEDLVQEVAERCRAVARCPVFAHSNSRQVKDSYNWSLMRLLKQNDAPMFDYVFIDGAHTWDADALSFLLADRMLVPGGYVDFDDYDWTIAGSKAMQEFEPIKGWYTEQQTQTKQVALVVELLAKRMDYREIHTNKIFRKRVAKTSA
jgi:predicted O-methyltransferase YrrM